MERMEFSVNTRALPGLADMWARRDHDLTRTADYLDAQSVLQWGQGLLNAMFGTHERIIKEVDAFLRRAGGSYLHRYSLAVAGAVEDYRTSDLSANARVDAILPGLPAPGGQLADQTLGPEIFADPRKLVLKIPPDFRGEFAYQPTWTDLLSPSTIDRDVIWSLTGVAAKLGLLPHPIDPYETFTLPLFGDWPGMARVSFALTQVAQAVSFVGERIDSGAVALDRVWTGHAASNCAEALGRFTLDLEDAEGILYELATMYHDVAVAAHDKAEALSVLVALVLDIAGSLGVEAIVELVTDAPKVVAAASKIAQLIPDIQRIVESLHQIVEGAQRLGELRTDALTIALHGSMNAHLPDDMPVLPTPPHR